MTAKVSMLLLQKSVIFYFNLNLSYKYSWLLIFKDNTALTY